MSTVATDPSETTDTPVLTVSPDMVEINGSKDADWMLAFWKLVRSEAAAGRTVQVVPRQITYTPAEAARLVDVSKATVLRRINDGTIKAVKRGAHWRIPQREVERYSQALIRQMAQLVADDIDFGL